MVLRFGPFRFDLEDGSLDRTGEDVPLPPRARDTLICLVEQPGRVMSKEALIDKVWGQTHVSDTALKEAVFLIRRALGDDPQKPSYIQTVHRKGYRFVATINSEPVAAEARVEVEPSRWQVGRWLAAGRWPVWMSVVALVTMVLAIGWVLYSRDASTVRVVRAALDVPLSHELLPLGLALSADGEYAVYVGTDEDRRLYRRRLSAATAELVAGTDGARRPFFFPDGLTLGFFADGRLKTVPLEGGRPRDLASAPRALGGTWVGPTRSSGAAIIYAGGPEDGLHRVDVVGGPVTVLTRPDVAAGELAHRWPEALPGQSIVLYTAWRGRSELSSIVRFDLDTGRGPVLGRGTVLVEGGSHAVYLASGYLLFGRGNQLMAVRYRSGDTAVSGAAVPVLDGIEVSESQGAIEIAVSGARGGVLIHTSEDAADLRTFEWLDPEG